MTTTPSSESGALALEFGGRRVRSTPPSVPIFPDPSVFPLESLHQATAALALSLDGGVLKEPWQDGLRPRTLVLTGPPGCGKTTFAHLLAHLSGLEFYELQGHPHLTQDDLAFSLGIHTNTPTGMGRWSLKAGPLATAWLRGGFFLFDDVERAPTRALAPLVSLLDERAAVYSNLIGGWGNTQRDRPKVRPRLCFTANVDSLEGLPTPLKERLGPAIRLDSSAQLSAPTSADHAPARMSEFLREFVDENRQRIEQGPHTEAPQDPRVRALLHTLRGVAHARAFSLLREGEIAKALEAVEDALPGAPDSETSLNAMNTKADLLMLDDRLDDARSLIDRLLSIESRLTIAHATRGDILLRMERFGDAHDAYSVAYQCMLEHGEEGMQVTTDGHLTWSMESYLEERLELAKSRLDGSQREP